MFRRLLRYPNPVRAAQGRAGSDEGVALLFVLMAMLILSSLSLLALGAIVVQVKPTQYQRKSIQTINAAEAGLHAGLAAIRNGTYTEGVAVYGDRAQLPCWLNFVGQVGDPSGGVLKYSVTIRYYKLDPSEQTEAWRTSNAMPCTDGIGTTTTPTHALIVADGIGATLPKQAASVGNRSLQSVYTFKSTNPNLPGGLIKDASGLCYSGNPVTGGAVTMATCLAGAPTQMWAYTVGYQIVLTSTRASDGSGGLCLSALIGTGSSVAATMQTCDPTAKDYTQTWGVNDSDPVAFFGHLKGTYSSSWCLGVATTNVVGIAVKASSTCTGVFPQAQVGAGAAGTALKTPAEVSGLPFQWVNYQEFGRCLDVTGWNVDTVSQILYPCKQDPMAGGANLSASPGWNEMFRWDQGSKHFSLRKDASNKPYLETNPAYCMRSPNSNGGYVLFSTLCSAITPATDANFTWTLNRDTSDSKTSYTIVDSFNRCLAAGAKNPANTPNYSSVTTATCDGSSSQKWNAPASLGEALVGDTEEVPKP